MSFTSGASDRNIEYLESLIPQLQRTQRWVEGLPSPRSLPGPLPSAKLPVLLAIAGNAARTCHMPPRNTPRKRRGRGGPTNPAQRRKQAPDPETYAENNERTEDAPNDEQTPRASTRLQTASDGPLQLPPSLSAGAKSQRPRSPTNMAELKNLPAPLHLACGIEMYDIDNTHPLRPILALLEDIQQHSMGLNVLDDNTKVK